MKFLITFSILIFFPLKSFACCTGGMISIVPKSDEISQNPIILIDFMERDYKIFETLKNADFFLVDNKGKKIKLNVIERNKGFHTWAQILLKPKKQLKLGRAISIRVSGINAKKDLQKKFIEKVQSRKWKVKYEKDKIAPTFTSGFSIEYLNHLNWSVSGHGIKGHIDFCDNIDYYFKNQQGIKKEIIFEVINEEGKRYLLTLYGGSLWIYHGVCGATFSLKQDKEYTFKIRLMDLSGNMSLEINELKFKTENASVNRISLEELKHRLEKKN